MRARRQAENKALSAEARLPPGATTVSWARATRRKEAGQADTGNKVHRRVRRGIEVKKRGKMSLRSHASYRFLAVACDRLAPSISHNGDLLYEARCVRHGVPGSLSSSIR